MHTATETNTAPAKAGFVNFDLAGAALLHTNLEKSCRWVLVALCSYANRAHHQAWPSVSSLAERAGCSERTARAQLRYLERAGYIRTVRNGAYSTTAYQIEATKLQLEQAAGTTTTPFFAPTEIAGGAAKTAWGAAKTVTERAEIAAKEGKKKDIEKEKEEGGNAHAHATPLTTEVTFPPLPPSVFENLPALNSPAVARSTTLPTAPAPTPAPAPLPTSASPAEPQPAPAPAPSADTLVNTPAPSTADAAPTLPDTTVANINAQRAKNGKGKFTAKDVATLAAEAAKAGITAEAAAAYILAKPTRNFFKADWYKPTSAPAPAAAAEEPTLDAKRAAATLASMIPAAPQTDEEKSAAAQAAAAAKARVRQSRKELQAKQAAAPAPAPAPVAAPAQPATAPSAHDLSVARQLAQRCAESNCTAGNIAALFTGTSATPITTAPTTPAAHTGPVAGLLPEVGPKKWAAAIVNRALRGQHVSRGPLEKACTVVGMSFADVQASRITATA